MVSTQRPQRAGAGLSQGQGSDERVRTEAQGVMKPCGSLKKQLQLLSICWIMGGQIRSEPNARCSVGYISINITKVPYVAESRQAPFFREKKSEQNLKQKFIKHIRQSHSKGFFQRLATAPQRSCGAQGLSPTYSANLLPENQGMGGWELAPVLSSGSPQSLPSIVGGGTLLKCLRPVAQVSATIK